ncbi:MAG: low molecular weight protein arginine phosphatase [Clostridia bacterium]|nr:low molecular weight protein arginine phosphatase [Clostridia bacterium]
MRVLFVCTGNTCRSPMAAALLRSKTRHEADSAGLSVFCGAPASENAVLAMRKYNIDISSHLSKPVTPALLSWADLILTMTTAHKAYLLARYPDVSAKTKTILEYVGKTGDIIDPYGGDLSDYEACASALCALIEEMTL